MVLIAIDPGASGGIAVRSHEGIVSAIAMPETEGDIVSFFRSIKPATSEERYSCYIEKVGGFIGGRSSTKSVMCQHCHKFTTYTSIDGQPGSMMFTFGRNVGFITGVVQATGIPLHEITPQAWQKGCCLGTRGGDSKTDWKNKIKALSQRLYPEIKVTLKTADALAILHVAKGLEGLNF
jgi:hypothetical protein